MNERTIGHVTLALGDAAQENSGDGGTGSIGAELLAIAKEHRIEQALAGDSRWQVLCQFSPMRRNLLSWYPFPRGSRLLEIGSGCGALTGVFLDAGLVVHCVEPDLQQAETAAHRYADGRPFVISVSHLEQATVHGPYDFVTLIGTLAEASRLMPEAEHPAEALLARAASLLRADGTLILAEENRLGLRYFAGAPEQSTGRPYEGIMGYPSADHAATFSRSELAELLQAAGFRQMDWFYPHPDACLPVQVSSDAALPQKENLFAGLVSYDQDRALCFDERAVLQSLAGREEYRYLANAFLIFCRKGEHR